MAALYAITLVGASAAAMGAAFMGGKMHPVGETGSPPVLETEVPLPEQEVANDPPTSAQTPEVEAEAETPVEEEADATVVETPVEADPVPNSETEPAVRGGAIGRPTWAPNPDAVPPKTLSSILTTVTQSIPTNTAAIQAELNKVTIDWENANYDIYSLGLDKKKILETLDGSPGVTGYRTRYRTASAQIHVNKMLVENINRKLQNTSTQTSEKGIDIIKKVLGKKFERNKDTEKDNRIYYERIIHEIEKEPEDKIPLNLRFDPEVHVKKGKSNYDVWWNLVSGNPSNQSIDISKLTKELISAETAIGTNEDIVNDTREEYERLTKELTDIRTKISEKTLLIKSLNERRLALINALSVTDKTITSARSSFRPISDQQLKDKLVEYNKALLDLEEAKRTFRSWYISDYLNADVKPSDDEVTAQKDPVKTAEKVVNRLRIALAGESSQQGTPLDKIIFELKRNAVPGTQALADLVPVFDVYYEVSRKTKAREIIDDLARYYKFFATSRDIVIGFSGQIVDRGFGYLFELSKRSEGTDYDTALKTFIGENRDIIYNAYANLKITQGVMESTSGDPSSIMNTTDAVRGLLEGKTKVQLNISKLQRSITSAFTKTDKDKIARLVEDFGRRIVDRLETVNIGRNWRGLKTDEISMVLRTVAEQVTDLSAKYVEKNRELNDAPLDTDEQILYAGKLQSELRSLAQQLLLVLQSEDPAFELLEQMVKNTFNGGDPTPENQRLKKVIEAFETKSNIASIELNKPLNRKPVTNLPRLFREILDNKIKNLKEDYAVIKKTSFNLGEFFNNYSEGETIPQDSRFDLRQDINNLRKRCRNFLRLINETKILISKTNLLTDLHEEINKLTQFVNSIYPSVTDLIFEVSVTGLPKPYNPRVTDPLELPPPPPRAPGTVSSPIIPDPSLLRPPASLTPGPTTYQNISLFFSKSKFPSFNSTIPNLETFKNIKDIPKRLSEFFSKQNTVVPYISKFKLGDKVKCITQNKVFTITSIAKNPSYDELPSILEGTEEDGTPIKDVNEDTCQLYKSSQASPPVPGPVNVEQAKLPLVNDDLFERPADYRVPPPIRDTVGLFQQQAAAPAPAPAVEEDAAGLGLGPAPAVAAPAVEEDAQLMARAVADLTPQIQIQSPQDEIDQSLLEDEGILNELRNKFLALKMSVGSGAIDNPGARQELVKLTTENGSSVQTTVAFIQDEEKKITEQERTEFRGRLKNLFEEKDKLREEIKSLFKKVSKKRGGNHTTRRQWVRSRPSRFTRHNIY